MRIKALVAALVVGSGIHGFAQASDQMEPAAAGSPPPPPAQGPGQGEDGRPGRDAMKRRFLDSLPPDARQRFEAAREKALQDPKIQELRQKSEQGNREFFEAMRAKMQEIDPGLADLIKQNAPDGGQGGPGGGPGGGFKGDRKDGKGPGDGKGVGPGGPGGASGMANLTDAERTELMNARAKAKEDPAVIAAQQKKEAATAPDARRAAGEEYHAAMHAAMVKADPAVEAILKKLGPPPVPPAQAPAPAASPAQAGTPKPKPGAGSDNQMAPGGE